MFNALQKKAVKMAFPLIVSDILNYLYTTVGTYYIALIDKSSSAILSGVGLVFPLYNIFFAIALAAYIGTSAVISRCQANERETKMEKIFSNSIWLFLFIGGVLGITSLIWSEDIIYLMAGSEISDEALNYANIYYKSILPGLFILIIAHVYYGICQGVGDSKKIMIATGIGSILNIILAPLFIFTLNLGIAGAGIATSVSMLANCIYIYISVKKSKGYFTTFKFLFDANMLKEIFSTGLAQFLGIFAMSFTMILLNQFISSISENIMAAWQIYLRTCSFVIMPAFAMHDTTLTMMGEKIGIGDYKESKKIYFSNIKITLLIVGVVSGIYTLLSSIIFPAFTDQLDVINMAIKISFISAIPLSISSIAILSEAACKALYKPIYALILIALRGGVMIIPVLYILSQSNLDSIFIISTVAINYIIVSTIAFFFTRSMLDKNTNQVELVTI